jgi:hypothetical protein
LEFLVSTLLESYQREDPVGERVKDLCAADGDVHEEEEAEEESKLAAKNQDGGRSLEKSMLRIIQFWRKKLEKCYILGTLDQV